MHPPGAMALAQLPHLEWLSSENSEVPGKIGDEGAQALCALGSTLRHLDVVENKINAPACVQLATSLTKLTELRVLHNGAVGTRGFREPTVELAHALCALQGLRVLWLSVGEEEVEVALHPLKARGVKIHDSMLPWCDGGVW